MARARTNWSNMWKAPGMTGESPSRNRMYAGHAVRTRPAGT